MARKPATIPDAEWVIDIRCETSDGVLFGPITARYSDSYAAQRPEDVGTLVGKRLAEHIEMTRTKKGRKR